MKIHFYGAARTVTGSQYLVEVNGKRLLLECGLFQGRRNDTYTRNQNFSFDPGSLDAVILSHAHLDHSGNLPNLVKKGFHGPIYTTPGSADLADIMLRDSGHIQEADADYVNKKHFRHGVEPVEPLYTLEDAAKVAQYFHPVEYARPFNPVAGVTAQLFDAGHILGSAAVALDVREDGRAFRFWFSGDIGRLGLPLLKDPVLPQDSDYLMMECTYGDSPHVTPGEAYREFRDALIRTVKRGGKMIVPSFAVGRTQELVYFLNEMIANHEIAPLPVYVDSPLAVSASKIFERHPKYFDQETYDFIRANKHPALEFAQLRYVESVEESKKLNSLREPMVIISASGMAEAGRILHHLKNNIEDARNMIAIVGWQAPDTLGRRLKDGEQKVRIFGEWYRRKAEVVNIDGLSAHAGQDLLISYAQSSQKKLKQLVLVHGEPDAESVFEAKLKEAGIGPTAYPELGAELNF